MSRSLKFEIILTVFALSINLCYGNQDQDRVPEPLDDEFVEYLDLEDDLQDDVTIHRETDCTHFCYSVNDKCCGYSSPLWGNLCRSGKAQSPINLPSCKTQKMPSPPLNIDGDQYKGKFMLTNDGNAVVLQFLDPKTVNISGAGTYNLDNIRFHWGSNDTHGSEHCIKRSSGGGCARETMELQLVHYKSTKQDLQTAIESGQRNAVLVLSLLLRVTKTKEDDGGSPIYPVLNPVVKQLEDVKNSGESATVKHTFDLTTWLATPNTASSYFGSLTMPKCKQVARWIVLQTPMAVKAQDVTPFRSLKQVNGEPILSNRRPMQKRNKRDIQCYQVKFNNLPAVAETVTP